MSLVQVLTKETKFVLHFGWYEYPVEPEIQLKCAFISHNNLIIDIDSNEWDKYRYVDYDRDTEFKC